jgi:hypothetical protein
MVMEKYTPNRARFFVRKKYTTFSTIRIVALRSVNKIFPESYDIAAMAPHIFLGDHELDKIDFALHVYQETLM